MKAILLRQPDGTAIQTSRIMAIIIHFTIFTTLDALTFQGASMTKDYERER
jgi:hypothetical protein